MSSNAAFDILNAAGAAIAETRADTGAGFQGEWPEDGDHLATITGITVDAAPFRVGRTDLGVQCAVVRFSYKRVGRADGAPDEDPNNPANEMAWDGAELNIVSNPSALPDCNEPNKKPELYRNIANMSLARYKGIAAALLQKPEDEVSGSDLPAIVEMVQSGQCVVEVRTTSRKSGNTVYRTDYIRAVHSG